MYSISAYACYFQEPYNFWYQIDYEIQNESLPDNVRVNVVPYIINNGGAYEPAIYPETSGRLVLGLSTAPQLRFTNASDSTIYLNSHSENVLEPGSNKPYDIRREIKPSAENPQSPGGIQEPAPSPFPHEFFIIQDSQRFTIPMTVTYSLNGYYDENKIGADAPLSDYLMLSDAVVLGEFITETEDSQIYEDYFTEVHALVQVEEWLLGDGPAEIEVGYFGPCGWNAQIGHKAYFLLSAPEDPASIQYIFVGDGSAFMTADDTNKVRIETAIHEFLNPSALSIADEPMHSLFLPYISR